MGPRSHHLLNRTAIVAMASALLLITAAGCGDSDDDSQADATNTTRPTTTVAEAPSTTTTPAGPTTTHPLVIDTAPTLPAKPTVCTPDMGTTLLAQYWYPPYPPAPDPPPGWQAADPDTFDWDADSTADTLTLTDSTVTVDWGTGQLTITGVNSDYFNQPATDDDGGIHQIATQEEADRHTPAAVGDVTGDGLPDLIVSHGGHTAVLIGQGETTPTGTIAFDDVGRTTLGWRSPPQYNPEQYSPDGEPTGSQLLFPQPVADVAVLWDDDGDGANEFTVTRWPERSAPNVVRFGGVPCSLP